ncbi:MAG TPA: roadblock/LC7 domain-containing protein [Amycolatopsis sp.]|uniref:roadblock/LC7 domain-containing protein n=1 Tax=Amycolatopsis sp. TaxID=37632 RepID=UPI002B45E5BE|nr:roadblock/LC7 domain-containing protein [Amycolatopsis sp.]HKS44945.1 roadblock/LC7 domain-containing protein [Amycolatopsis sp.]
MNRTLRKIRDQLGPVNGLLVATRDGLVLSSDTEGIEDANVAAMAATAIGLAIQFTAHADVGEARTALFEGCSGHVAVFPVETGVLLVVLGEKDTNMGLFNIAAKQALSQLREVLEDTKTDE